MKLQIMSARFPCNIITCSISYRFPCISQQLSFRANALYEENVKAKYNRLTEREQSESAFPLPASFLTTASSSSISTSSSSSGMMARTGKEEGRIYCRPCRAAHVTKKAPREGRKRGRRARAPSSYFHSVMILSLSFFISPELETV